MSKLRNIILLVVLTLTICMCTSCKGKPKTFSSSGITVTLTSSFKEQNIQGVQVVYVSRNIGFMGNPEAKSALSLGKNKLETYTEKVLNANNLQDIDYYTYDQDNVKFCYAYYNATVQNNNYRYMLITKEGNDHYYTMNFWSFANKFDKYETQFLEWAKQIIVE